MLLLNNFFIRKLVTFFPVYFVFNIYLYFYSIYGFFISSLNTFPSNMILLFLNLKTLYAIATCFRINLWTFWQKCSCFLSQTNWMKNLSFFLITPVLFCIFSRCFFFLENRSYSYSLERMSVMNFLCVTFSKTVKLRKRFFIC